MMNEPQQLSEMNVATMEAGYRRLLRKLESEGFQIKEVKPINENRYLIAKGFRKAILITYKREPFYNFGSMFRKEGFKGVGDSLNIEDLKTAIQNKVKTIYTIFPNGRAYSISMKDFLNNSIKWKNKEGKFVRSVSIHEYKLEFKL